MEDENTGYNLGLNLSTTVDLLHFYNNQLQSNCSTYLVFIASQIESIGIEKIVVTSFGDREAL